MASPATVGLVQEVVEFFARAPSRADIAAFRLSPDARERLRGLLERNAAELLTADEQRELDQIVLLDDIMSLIRARAQGSAFAGAADAQTRQIPRTEAGAHHRGCVHPTAAPAPQ